MSHEGLAIFFFQLIIFLHWSWTCSTKFYKLTP